MPRAGQRNLVAFKVTNDELALLDELASQSGESAGQVARRLVMESLSGFDVKQELFLRKLEQLSDDTTNKLALNTKIAVFSAISGALPFDWNSRPGAEITDGLRDHVRKSWKLSESLLDRIVKNEL